MTTLRLVLRRVAATVPMLILVAVLTFAMVSLTPGDPAVIMAGESASPELIEETRESMGLDEPLTVQFVNWVSGAAVGDLGTSFADERPVADLILERLPVTLSLTFGSVLIGLLIAIPAGVFAAVRRGSLADRATIFLTSLGISAPEFFLGLMIVLVFALTLGWFPATGYVPLVEDPGMWALHLVLPCLALGLGVAAELARQVRGSMREVLEHDYIQTARAKGVSTTSVLVKHGLKNAAVPVVTVLGLQVRRLLGGTVVIEQVFIMDGVGDLAVSSVFQRDLPALMGIALVAAVIVLLVNLVVDLSYSYFDPKVRVS
ncbi:peptide/nickel transport system permease protein [Lipingzhangella halophila]|uniref:Peptide/nickel transport system permease protein n=1 Tax=Lipingzhangella halophila TaxID=1783352 RepID=A0A7W7RNZ9_9ACTN|nr:ABC transporter permease [Lipingzhangella halophila]MBB4934961.1 peptide/nickel transport system permease protein [Lipingzhangella halophila]